MPSPQAHAVSREQTRAVRHPCEVPTTCQPPYGWAKDPWSAVIRDIAADGLSLSMARRFECGSGLAIELPGEGGIASTVLARVARLTALPGGWLIDCAFISELADEEVLHVLQLDPLHQAMLGDTEVITDITAVTSTIVHDVLFRAVLEPGQLLRWFVKRLDLYGCWPLARGKGVAFRVGGLPASTPPVELIVQRCALAEAFWVVDATLAAPPAEEVLRLLSGSDVSVSPACG